MNELHVDVFTRFKKNTNFYELPARPAKAKRGRPRIYGAVFKMQDWIENDKSETFRERLSQYGGTRYVEFKTMIATTKITKGRSIRLVLSRCVDVVKSSDWSVFASTNLNATPREILLEYSRRFSIEEMFKDLKGVCGLGSQEVRKWESCKACTTITTTGFTDVEIGTWERDASELTTLRPRWDVAKRRPSHKNKRDRIARKIAFENFTRNIMDAKTEDIQKEILRLASLLGLAV